MKSVEKSTTISRIIQVYICIDNLGPPDKPIIKGPTEVQTGETIEFNYNTKDPDGDKFWYKMDFFTGIEYGSSKYLYNSNETFIWVTIVRNPGEHKFRIKAVDVNGYESEWSDIFYITAYEKSNIFTKLKEIFIKT